MVQFFLERERVSELVTHLRNQKPVYAPHRRGSKSYSFELVEDPQAVVLDYPRVIQSIRKYFLPPREKLMTFDLKENSFEPVDATPSDAIFFGVHSYDLAAVHRLDYNFSEGNPERHYLTRRQGAIFVGVSYEPDEYHFSGSVGIDPYDTTGFDLFLTKLLDGYIVEACTETGEKLLDGLEMSAHEAGKPARGHFHQHIFLPQAKLGKVLADSYRNPVWEETAVRCVGCGTCNLVCPTCYCFNMEDAVNVQVTGGSRGRRWDGCMLRDFSRVAGGEVFREPLAERQRHRVYRKFKYISDETGQPWCVGCGRCTAACPADISIVSIINRLVGDYEKVAVTPI